jgi:hypothetical protein
MNARWAVPLVLLGLAGSTSAQPVLNPQTGHYYELVLAADIGWFAARHGAAQLSFGGLPGHLVTITSAGENDFLYATFATGSTDALAWTGGWEPNDDGVWRWAVAPEAGAQYASGSSPDPPGSYVNWVGAEPNDFAADEDFMSYLIGGFSGFEGGWADSPEVSTGSDPIVGYLVEYEPASSSGVILDPGTGNHYELVLATGIGWFAARDQAAQRTFLGLPGHLVTITSQGENDFLYATFATGSTDALVWTGGWEPADDGVWRWAVGPEAGIQYSSGASPVPPLNYASWVGTEPNDLAVDEDFMSYVIGGFSGSEGDWADSPDVNGRDDPIVGYLVEYETQGATPGEPSALRVVAVDEATGELELSYTPGCAAVDHSIVFGPLADVSSYGYSGQVCSLGASGVVARFDPGPGSFFFLVVGNDGAGVEGSYGTNGEGTERPEDLADPVCAALQDLSGRCD